jgi:hypothetical protein
MKLKYERHFFFLVLPGGAGSRRPAAVKGAPFFRRGVSEPLTARTAVDASSRKEKVAHCGAKSFCGGSYDE